MILIKHVTKTYHDAHCVVNDVSMDIQQGETIVILGSSGSGKTTLLKMINRLIEPSSGMISISGVDTREIDKIKLKRSIGYVFQGVGLFPHLSVAENIAILLRLLKIPKIKITQKINELLCLVNLDPDVFAGRFPFELSGGQQQRVGVARALANDPEILLMDEPFAALDVIVRRMLQDELIHLKKSLNKTIVFVTHDIFEALRLADRIAVMNQGRLEQLGTKHEILNAPSTNFVKSLFEKATQQLKEYEELFN